MSGPFDAKYTDDQREAAAAAYLDGLTAKEVAAAAADGRLKLNGAALEPFTIPWSTVGAYGSKLRARRAGKADTKVSELPHRDAIETLRRRLLNMAHEGIALEERKKPANRDTARIREWARCVLEASRLPGPSEPRTATPDTRTPDGRKGSTTRGGAAGALLAEHRQTAPAQDVQRTDTTRGDVPSRDDIASRSNGAEAGGEAGAVSGARADALPLVG
jgi:hypothetical protein